MDTLYQLNAPFCWKSIKIGYYGGFRHLAPLIPSILGISYLHRIMRDELIAILGASFAIASFILDAFAYNDLMMYLVPLVGMMTFTMIPITRSMMSRMAEENEQGALFSSIAAVESVCNSVSHVLYNGIYISTVSVFRGAVYISMAGFSLLTIACLVLFMYISRHGWIVASTTTLHASRTQSERRYSQTHNTRAREEKQPNLQPDGCVHSAYASIQSDNTDDT